MTRKDVEWAKLHHWYRSHTKLNRTDGEYRVVVVDERSSMGIRYFTDFNEMQQWAGYTHGD